MSTVQSGDKATVPTMSKSEQSRLVLEWTFFGAFAILLLWMITWKFRDSRPGDTTAVVFAREMKDIGKPVVPKLKINSLKMRELTTDAAQFDPGSGSEPLVILASIPGTGLGFQSKAQTEERQIQTLIENASKIASGGRGVLLAIDGPFYHTERNLGVYANSFAYRVAEIAREQISKNGSSRLVILLGAAPGQLSWIIDAENKSCFAHFLDKALGGAIQTWEPASVANGRVSARAIARYVQSHVAAWTKKCRNAEQTPVLIGETDFRLSLPSASTIVAPKPADETAPAESKPPRLLVEQRANLEAAWKEFDELRTKQFAYRYSPRNWRTYQEMLLFYERQVRKNALASAEALNQFNRIKTIAEDLRKSKTNARSDEAWTRSFALANQDPAASKESQAIQLALSNSQSATIPTEEQRKQWLKALTLENSSIIPKRLEDQILVWSIKYLDAGGQSIDRQGELINQIREYRIQQEKAAANLDAFEWVAPFLAKGDKTRRKAQDSLFGNGQVQEVSKPAGRVLEDSLRQDISPAIRAAMIVSASSDLLKEITSDIAYLGDWTCRQDGRPDCVDVLDKARALREVLNRGVAKSENPDADLNTLQEKKNEIDKVWKELTNGFDKACDPASRLGSLSWKDLDDLLRVPRIPVAKRMAILDDLIKAEENDLVEISAAQAKVEPIAQSGDSFSFIWKEALRIAKLDARIRLLVGLPERTVETDRFSQLFDQAEQAADRNQIETGEPFKKFEQLTLASVLSPTSSIKVDGADAGLKGWLAKAQAENNRIRGLTILELGGVKSDVDDMALEKAMFARTLAWQTHRLLDDFAPEHAQKVLEDAKRMAADARADLEELLKDSQGLVGSDLVDLDKRIKAQESADAWTLTMATNKAEDNPDRDNAEVLKGKLTLRRGERTPEGQAVVIWTSRPPDQVKVTDPAGAFDDGSLIPLTEGIRYFQLVRAENAPLEEFSVNVKPGVFYRGRVLEDKESSVKFPKLTSELDVRIHEDLDRLYKTDWERYPMKRGFFNDPVNGRDGRRFEDQFRKGRVDEAYFHANTNFYFKLELANQRATRRQLYVTYAIDGEPKPNETGPIELQPKPEGRKPEYVERVTGLVTASQLTKGRKLTIKVYEERPRSGTRPLVTRTINLQPVAATDAVSIDEKVGEPTAVLSNPERYAAQQQAKIPLELEQTYVFINVRHNNSRALRPVVAEAIFKNGRTGAETRGQALISWDRWYHIFWFPVEPSDAYEYEIQINGQTIARKKGVVPGAPKDKDDANADPKEAADPNSNRIGLPTSPPRPAGSGS